MPYTFFQNYGTYFILLAALVGFVSWRKLNTIPLKVFPVYLLLIFIGDTLGAEYSEIYFVLLPLQIVFFTLFIGFSVFPNKWWSILATLLYIVFYIWEVRSYPNGQSMLLSKSYSFGSVFLAILVLAYCFKLATSIKLTNYYNDMLFWVCLGVSLYYVAAFPFFALYNTLFEKYPSFFYSYRSITAHLSAFMYLIFTTGFLCIKKK